MEICNVCQKEVCEVVSVADIAASLLLVCGGCADLHQEDHFEDLFRSPIDFDLLNADRRLLRQAA